MHNIRTIVFSAAALAAAVLIATGCASPGSGSSEVTSLVDQYVAQSFVPGPGQDMSRLRQDQTQKDCTDTRAKPPEGLAKEIMAREARNITYPDGGKLVGDWKAGAKVFNDGFGFRVGSFMATPATVPTGGNCYACHQGEAKEAAYGDLGPSLRGYSKLRGQGEATAKYTYEKIYNSRAFSACSNMPRLGHNKILSPEQVADLTAYLLAPESPINQ